MLLISLYIGAQYHKEVPHTAVNTEAESGAGEVNRAGTGRQESQTAPAPARHQRARCAGVAAGQGAAAASAGRDGAGTRGHATIEPLRLVWALFVVPPATKQKYIKGCFLYT